MRAVFPSGISIGKSRGTVMSSTRSVCTGLLMLLMSGLGMAQCGAAPMLAGGDSHTLALSADGTVQAWGRGGDGQLGMPFSYQWSPLSITALSGVATVAAGENFSLALLADGSLKSWGENWGYQLGLGHDTNQFEPQPIPGLAGVTAVSAGSNHSLALLSDGTVKAWGFGGYGQLGLGSAIIFANTPQSIPGLSGVTAVRAGREHSLALLANGTVMAWGSHYSGQLGLGLASMIQYTPQPITGLTNVLSVAAGREYSLARLADGTVKAWGNNGEGQLGLGNTTSQFTPQIIPGLANVTAVAAGTSHSLALINGGTLKAWGNNQTGELGIGNTMAILNTPQTVSGLSSVTGIGAGAGHSLAVLADNSVKSWGRNHYGQLGIGNTTQQNAPQPILGFSLNGAVSYSLVIMVLNPAAVGITIPCNTEIGALGLAHYYFNVFSVDPLNASSPGTGTWYGLHATQADVFAWLDAGFNGLTFAFGALGSSGGASASVAIPPALLAGLTVHGVSVALNPLTGVVADSNVASHTF